MQNVVAAPHIKLVYGKSPCFEYSQYLDPISLNKENGHMIEEKMKQNHALAQYCTFQIGGPADHYLNAESVEDVLEGIRWAEEHDMPVFIFGGGSNLLFDDAGFRGLVIRNRSENIEIDGLKLIADAGVRTTMLVMNAMEHGLSGIEAWNGLPGTVGGAVYGNAGCFDLETKDVLESAEIYFPDAGVKTLKVDELEYGYRTSRLKHEPGFVLRATFALHKNKPEEIREMMMEIVKKRVKKQPSGLSTGSFFKNPFIDKAAGMLIDQCGLKGYREGSMEVSDQHANFFVNKGGATSADVLALQSHVEKTVLEKFGIQLEREIIFVPSE